ncbi:MAG TPA: hypothetical protein VF866_06725 [Xanthobacteraceae bacterium]
MVVAEVRRRMTPAAFKQSLNRKTPPAGVSTALQALWWAAGGDWDKAHRIVMGGHDQECAWVHAYLHRVEGDLDNAAYWYRQARRKAATGELSSECDEIVAALLQDRRR